DNMKIDTHIHITPPDIIKDYKKIGEKEPYFKLLSETPHNKFATTEQVVEHLSANAFDKGVVFGFSFQDAGLCRYVNDYTLEAIKQYPEQLIGFMTYPVDQKGLGQEIERCYKGGIRGIGELFPEGQHLDLENLHKTELKDYAKSYNLPILLHTNELVGHYYAGKTSVSLQSVEAFIRHHQDLPIILAHMGGGLIFYELMKEVRACFKNVYYDTAASIFLYDAAIYRALREMGVLDKVLFGTDYPLLPITRYESSLVDLTDGEKQAVLGGNAQRLFEQCKII
ncbi:MAG: amidohydrolase family protein, partial [Niameybacter sp.]